MVLLLPEGAGGCSKSLKWPFLRHNEARPPPPAPNGASQRCNCRKTDEGWVGGWICSASAPGEAERSLLAHQLTTFSLSGPSAQKLTGGDYSVKFVFGSSTWKSWHAHFPKIPRVRW